jgi:hypothetical protein
VFISNLNINLNLNINISLPPSPRETGNNTIHESGLKVSSSPVKKLGVISADKKEKYKTSVPNFIMPS